MKMYRIISFVMLILISTGLYAQDFYSYNLFNNKFQAVFPGEPSLMHVPKEMIDPIAIENSIPYKYKKQLTREQVKGTVANIIEEVKNRQGYQYTDRTNQIVITVQSFPSFLEHKNYIWKGIQKTIDDTIKNAAKANNLDISDFSSTIDKKNDAYTAIYTYSHFIEGQKLYGSGKQIYYKDRNYKWNVGYVNKADKVIFDDYQEYCKIIN